ncbi:MAG TPA: VCBS repeat-containing protein, partial [Vicinamibacteria bacterium]|nr:VCBS repeat-containing protein [Vicinamibacteria bacterium]
TGTSTCTVTMSAAQSVTATFNLNPVTYTLTVTKAGTGTGTVTSSPAGISCGATCSASYNSGTAVTLTASPAAGSTFAGWSGACTGTSTCTVTMSSAQSVTATFSTTESVPLGDFNHDGWVDILWHNGVSGSLNVWLLVDGKSTGNPALGPGALADPNWQVRGLADFSGDGNTDLLWHNSATGQVYVWRMNETTVLGGSYLSPDRFADTNWRIKGVGDFNGDGKPDLLWQHKKTGGLYVWLMNGLTAISGVYLNPGSFSGVNWQVRAVADFNGDGKPELLLQSQKTGDLYVLSLSGTSASGGTYLSPSRPADASWQVARVADFDGDGHVDILWQNAQTGDLYVWFLKGTVRVGGAYLAPSRPSDPSWKIAPQPDYPASSSRKKRTLLADQPAE